MKRYAHGMYWEQVGSKNMWVARDVRFTVPGLSGEHVGDVLMSYDTLILAREGTVSGYNVYAQPYMWCDDYEDVSATTYRHVTHFLGYLLGKRNRCREYGGGELYTINGDVWYNVQGINAVR